MSRPLSRAVLASRPPSRCRRFRVGLLCAGLSFLLPAMAEAATYTVTTTNDSGIGSLRQAMLDANATGGADTIAFNIPGAGPHVIRPQTSLPGLTGPTMIDGYTQPGSGVNTAPVGSNADIRVVLEGNGSATSTGLSLLVGATGSTIRGLAINQFGSLQILAIGAGCTIGGNFIGTDVTGSIAYPGAPGSRVGVSLGGDGCRIGGSRRADRNVVAGNSSSGIHVGASNVVVEGNIVGTNRLVTAALGNRCGIVVGNGNPSAPMPTGIRIGGAAAGQAQPMNYISGNTDCGIHVMRGENLVIEGNAIGLAALGLATIPNAGAGIEFGDARYVTVGSLTDATARQYITGNDGPGIRLRADSRAADYIYIVANSIHSNGGLAIDLQDSSGDGVTPNDPLDEDDGPNRLQNFPQLTSAMAGDSTLTVTGTLHGRPGTQFLIDFYSSPACHSSGHGGGASYLGYVVASTNASGNVTFQFNSATVPVGVITATASAALGAELGSTSEFSACLPVGASDTIFRNGFER